MIDRKKATFTPVCDCCGAELPEEWDYMDAINAMRANGWKQVPPSDTVKYWYHICPACTVGWDYD